MPTADAQILPRGTGYLTDVGMNGNHYSILGVDTEGPLQRFVQQLPVKFSHETTGPLEGGALVIDVDPSTRKTTAIAQIRKIMNA